MYIVGAVAVVGAAVVPVTYGVLVQYCRRQVLRGPPSACSPTLSTAAAVGHSCHAMLQLGARGGGLLLLLLLLLGAAVVTTVAGPVGGADVVADIEVAEREVERAEAALAAARRQLARLQPPPRPWPFTQTGLGMPRHQMSLSLFDEGVRAFGGRGSVAIRDYTATGLKQPEATERQAVGR
jgi:hypothetical protein